MYEHARARTRAEADPGTANFANLFSILQDAAADCPEKTALVHGDRGFTYGELHSAAELLAWKLAEAGIRAGDKVGLLSSTAPEYLAVFFAVARVGAIVVPIPRALKAYEVSDVAEQMELDAFCYSRTLGRLVPGGSAEAGTEVTLLPDRRVLAINTRAGSGTVKGDPGRFSKESVAMMRFSSGTTGRAKGIVLSKKAILARADTFCRAYSVSEDCCIADFLSTELATPPLLGCLSRRAKVVFEDAHKLEAIARLVSLHGVTHIQASPLFYKMMAGNPLASAADLRNVRYVISTGAPLAASVAKAFREKFGREILQYYALGECGTVFANTSERIEKRGSSGTPVPGCDAKLVKSTSSGAAEIGELWVRGSGLFEGYYQPPTPRDEVLEDGWFRTGDVARRDSDGYYWIIGRTKDVINVGGVTIFPAEIEEVLLSHPAVDEAVVFGTADPKFTEVPRAQVRLARGAACTAKELIEFSNQRLSVFRRPRSIEIVPELPKTPTGKLKRAVS